MYKVQTLNKIAKVGLNVFDDKYTYGDEVENPDGIIQRFRSARHPALLRRLRTGDAYRARRRFLPVLAHPHRRPRQHRTGRPALVKRGVHPH